MHRLHVHSKVMSPGILLGLVKNSFAFITGILVGFVIFQSIIAVHDTHSIDKKVTEKVLQPKQQNDVAHVLSSVKKNTLVPKAPFLQQEDEFSSSSSLDGITVVNPTQHRHYMCGPNDTGIEEFRSLATSQLPVTDKVTTHSYQTMYGIFLSGLRLHPIKMLEIGLGCDMSYGPGASVKVWKKFLHSKSTIWMAEKDAACIEKHNKDASMAGVNIVTGNQGDKDTLKRWKTQMMSRDDDNTQFDVIIDDGGHTNVMIKNTLDAFWETLKPGGMYFVEDLQVGLSQEAWQDRLPGGKTMSDVMQSWVNSLLVGEYVQQSFPMPKNLQSIFCQREACVLFKGKS